MKQRFVTMIMTLFLIALFLFSGCTKKPIKIGFTGNLTGTSSEIAVQGMYGTMLAVEEINAQGGINGRSIELIVEDDGGSDATAVEADKKLIEAGVSAIIGHMISGVAGKAVPYINEAEMIMISPTISSSQFAYKDDYFYSMVPISEFQSVRIVQALNDYDYKRIGYLYQLENERYSLGFVNDIISGMSVTDITPTFIEGFSLVEESVFNENLDQILTSNVEALVIAGPAYDVARFAQVLYSKNQTLPIFTSTWAMGSDLIEIAGPAADGIFTINSYDSSSATDTFITFENNYMNKYGETPTFASVYAYEGMMMLKNAMEACDKITGPNIKRALTENSSFSGLQGTVTLDEFGDAHREMFLFQVENSRYKRID